MKCATCKRKMTQLFLTQVCDYCDFGPPEVSLYRGFVLLGTTYDSCGSYVFRTTHDAERFRAAGGHGEECSVREVFSLAPYRWQLSTGSLRDVVFAFHVFEIFQDHRYEDLPFRAFLKKEKDEHRDS